MKTRSEQRWVLWFAIFTMLVMTLPYLLGFTFQTTEWRYSGLLIASEDGYSYLAKMLSGASGDWLFRTPYTLVPQAGFLAFLPYLLLGKLTTPPGQYEQLVALFHLLKFSGGILAVIATYDFISLYIEPLGWRRLALVVSIFGGGLGILSVFGLGGLWKGPMPLEFYSPESFGFLGLLALPHLAWARALLLWGLVFYLQAHSWKAAVPAGGMWFVMGLFQPLAVVVGWAILAAHLLFTAIRQLRGDRKDWQVWLTRLKQCLVISVVSSPIVIYTFISFQIDPFLRRWQFQNVLTSPPPGDYLLAYGLVIPLVMAGIVHLWRTADDKNSLLLAWLCMFPILAYLPYNLQRRLPEGIWVALVGMAIVGALTLKPSVRRLVPIWLAIGLMPAMVLLVGGIAGLAQPGYPLFRPQGELAAFAYLTEHTAKGESILASYDTSTVLPAHASLRVAIGHGPESLGLAELKPRLEAFYLQETPDADRESILREMDFQYVFWGPLEREQGDWNPVTAGYLKTIYHAGDYQIFSVELDR
jgi:hypothetical protein